VVRRTGVRSSNKRRRTARRSFQRTLPAVERPTQLADRSILSGVRDVREVVQHSERNAEVLSLLRVHEVAKRRNTSTSNIGRDSRAAWKLRFRLGRMHCSFGSLRR
jgi:hypothetical protein